MNTDNLILELRKRAQHSDGLTIGLDTYDEILSAILNVISNASSSLKIVVNQKDPSHKSKFTELFDESVLSDALGHVKLMGVDVEVLSVHPDFEPCNLSGELITTFTEAQKKNVIKLQTDSEVIYNDSGDCLLFAKYKNNKKLPNNESINLFSLDKNGLNKSVSHFFEVLTRDLDGAISHV